MLPVQDKDGRELFAAVLKYTYHVDASGLVEPVDEADAPDIDLVDTYNGEDASRASIARPSMLFDYKPGTDVVLLGHAHSPRPGSAKHVDVQLRAGSIVKTVRAFGLRVWQKGVFGGLSAGPARPIQEPIPLIYELAWGGQDCSDPERPVADPKNPIGRGVSRHPNELVGQPAAQLESPEDAASNRHPDPASFGPIHRHWKPRADYAGTYDSRWMETRMPLLPADFDPMFHVCVPPDQWSFRPLRGDEPIQVLNGTPEGAWTFSLPRHAPGVSSVVRGQRSEHRTHLDTLLIDADTRLVEIVFRAAIPLPPKWELLERVLVFEKKVV